MPDDIATHMLVHEAHVQSFVTGIARNVKRAQGSDRRRVKAIGDADPQAHRVALGDLEVVDGADPDAPNRTIRRARVVCHYDVLWRAGGLKNHEREAADRYAITCDRESGAREAVGGHVGATAPWSRAPALTAIQAAASLRAANEAVGKDGTVLLRLYVRDNVSCAEIARRRNERQEQAMGRIKAALGRLAEHWGMRPDDPDDA